MSTPTALLVSAVVAAACSAALVVGSGGFSRPGETVILEGVADDAVSLSGPSATLVIDLGGFASVPPIADAGEGAEPVVADAGDEAPIVADAGEGAEPVPPADGNSQAESPDVAQLEPESVDYGAPAVTLSGSAEAEPDQSLNDDAQERSSSVAEHIGEPWKVAVLVVRRFDFEIDGERHVYEMNSDLLHRTRRAAVDLRHHLTDDSTGGTEVAEVDVMELDDWLTSITPRGDGYVFSEDDLGAVLDAYAPNGAYHSVLVVVELDRDLAGGGPVYVAEPSINTNGAMLAVVRAPGDRAPGHRQWRQWYRAIRR